MPRKRSKSNRETERLELANEQRYEIVDIDSIAVHPDNPRRGDVERIRASIRSNSFYGVVVCQVSTRYVLVGNHRLIAAKLEGLKHIPVIWLDVNDAKAAKILLVDNKLSDRAIYDDAMLASILDRISEDFEGSGYIQDDLDKLLSKLSAPEEFPSYDSDIATQYKCPKCGYEW